MELGMKHYCPEPSAGPCGLFAQQLVECTLCYSPTRSSMGVWMNGTSIYEPIGPAHSLEKPIGGNIERDTIPNYNDRVYDNRDFSNSFIFVAFVETKW